MTVESLPCAVCGDPVPLDLDHTEVEVENVRTTDRNALETFYLHDECARSTFEGWSRP